MTFSFKSFAIFTTALLYSAFSHADFYCELAAGYELPQGVEFAERCIDTDIYNEHILWLVKSEGRYGFVNHHGKIVIPLKFSYANSFYSGLAKIRLDDKWGLIDTTGKLIVPNDYDSISLPHDGLVRASIGGEDSRYGFLNLNNDVVIPFDYHYAEDFSEGFAIVGKGGKQGIIDKQNKLIVPMQYDYISPSATDTIYMKDWKWQAQTLNPRRVTIFDAQGEAVFPTYKDLGFFSQGLINVKKNDKWGLCR